MRSYPYFFYRDFSSVPDPDPLVPLTSPGRVANFPAKMHCILSRTDLADVVAWMPHGRAWRVLKPREFEINVIPAYFEHTKFSSFIRQINGWGFRRITQGRGHNSYYHEMFLRGLPHLCKMMKRAGVAEKYTADADHEPDLFKISEEKPLPHGMEDESNILHYPLQSGLKGRSPFRKEDIATSTPPSGTVDELHVSQWPGSTQMTAASNQVSTTAGGSCNNTLTETFHSSDSYSTIFPAMVRNPIVNTNSTAQSQTQQPHQQQVQPTVNYPQFAYSIPPPTPAQATMTYVVLPMSQNQMITPILTSSDISVSPNSMATLQTFSQGNSAAAAQFAAGFAAATAMSHQNIRQILGQILASLPVNNSNSNHGCSTNDTPQEPQHFVLQQQLEQQEDGLMRQHAPPKQQQQQQHPEQKQF